MLNNVQQVLTRISSIEARFAPKQTNNNSFSHQLAAAQTPEASVSPVQVERLVRSAAKRHGVDPNLAMAIARTESNLSPGAVSPVGAVGVMQLMPATAKELGVRDINNVWDNIDGGVRYLKQLQLKFKDDRLAVAAYNAGPGAVEAYQGVPPYTETQDYVTKVFGQYFKGK